MSKFRLAMTAADGALVARFIFGESHGGQSYWHAAELANQAPLLKFLVSLTECDGIPEHRLGYWNDPASNPRRIKGSREQMFERNGTTGRDIYTHPNVVRHLRYILFGGELPEDGMAEFGKWRASTSHGPICDESRKPPARPNRLPRCIL